MPARLKPRNQRPCKLLLSQMDLGFHHYNMQQTSREAFARPMGRRSTELLTTQVHDAAATVSSLQIKSGRHTHAALCEDMPCVELRR